MPSLDTRKLVPGLPEVINVKRVPSRRYDTLEALLAPGQGAKARALGASLRLSKKGSVESIALATETLVVQLTVEGNNTQSSGSSGSSLSGVLNHPRLILVGVGMAHILLLLHRQLNLRGRGIDLPIMFEGIAERGFPSPGDIACDKLHSNARKYAINALWYRHTNDELCLRAWLCACMVAEDLHDIDKVARVSTYGLRPSHLTCLSLHAMNVELLEAMKPTQMDNDFEGWEMGKVGKLVLHNARFKTKVRHNKQTFVTINGGEVQAYTDRVRGKKTTLTYKGKLPTDIRSVRVVGREDATSAENARDMFIVRLLQGAAALDHSPFVCLLWFPRSSIPRSVHTPQYDFETLNPSQIRVANAMVSGGNLIDRIQGPPGSGKTSTIAAGLKHFQECQQTVWVVAQSNVGVKNIARSIIKREIDFKLIVSMEFHFEWHEHLYKGAVEDTLIRSDELNGLGFDANRRIGKTHIMLSTLSMLSNPMLAQNGVFNYRPVEILIVDEASQIDTLEFMHLFDKFDKLRKVCMFGDPQQLPPYGKEQAPKMKTIFDFSHLKSASFFLDTQYRMPIELGRFISDAMYQSKLKSVHNVTGTACIMAIDVRKGAEQSAGSSWKNTEEAHTVVNLVRNYYKNLKGDFCIITPYDAQRGLITQLLKAANLPFDIVYNAPYVIVSAVRTTKPGFLSFNNRMNVMLSRCQRGMVLVTQRAFVEGGGKGTLLGRLVRHWEAAAGVDAVWADAMRVADGQANLPGAPGKLAMRLAGVRR
ncbi:ATP-dependent helicase upf1 [Trametes pubescens]|uniref:ATP-dependent helicase upf1 n=1 Tax=Trametes pubescens TaxID=154538 RepID=A0A1M2VJ82_TRAPU|nr:ATP-dependent helicase upf1 [Trametes pubescens]